MIDRPRQLRRASLWSTPNLLAAYYVTRAFMFAKSGLPQVADVLMVGLFARLRPPDLRWMSVRYMPYVGLVAWVCLVNGTWAVLQWERQFLVFASYYVFNLLVFTLIVRTWLREPERTAETLHLAAPVAVAVQLAITVADSGSRSTGTFNNPNQLAYFGLCALSVYLLTAPVATASRYRDFFVVGLVCWLELKAMSRAGIVAAGLVVLHWARGAVVTPRVRAAVVTAGVVAVAFVAIPELAGTLLPEDNLVTNVVDRFNARMTTYDELTARNVDRIRLYSEYTLLGAGEGDLERFVYDRNNEIHSTFGTLLFSYGVIGVTLFTGFLWQVARHLRRDQYVYLAAVLLYSLTHNGLRFTYGWIVLAVLAAIGERQRLARRRT